MTFYTVQLRAGAAPVLVPEAFSWGAAILGPVWLAAHRAWIAAGIALAAFIAIGVAGPGPVTAALWLAVAWVLGLFGNDSRRWGWEARGYLLVHVLAARDLEGAYGRLLAARPELMATAGE